MAKKRVTTTMNQQSPMMESNNPYSFDSFRAFISDNFSLIVIVVLFFVGGFFFGSVWTEKNMLKAGTAPRGNTAGNAAAGTGAAAPAPGERDLSIPALVAKAEAVGVDGNKVESCINSGETAQVVSDDLAEGNAAGVSGTPSSFLVLDGVVVDNIPGALPYSQVKTMIDQYLATDTPVAKPELANLAAVDDSDHYRGNRNARLVIVEYSDFECPFCEQFHPSMEQVMQDYNGEVAWVYRNYPLSFHPFAQKAAEAAECVAKLSDNDTYWEYADSLFAAN